MQQLALFGSTVITTSLGKGVDSSGWLAGLLVGDERVRAWADGTHAKLVVTADLESEQPETDVFMADYLGPALEAAGYEVVSLSPAVNDRHGEAHSRLYDYYMAQAALPSRVRRSCTERFKINTVTDWALAEVDAGSIQMVIGFDCTETDRAERLPESRGRIRYVTPLVDLGLGRLDCAELIMRAGLPVPRRSACFCCSFMRSQDWWELSWRHPGLYDDAAELERNIKRERGRDFWFNGAPLDARKEPRRFRVPARGVRLYELAAKKLSHLTPAWPSHALCLAARELWGEDWKEELLAMKIGPQLLTDPWQIFIRLMYCLEEAKETSIEFGS